MSDMVALTTEDQREAFEEAAELVREDAEAELIDPHRATRGRAAGKVPAGEVVRVVSEAYTGSLDLG